MAGEAVSRTSLTLAFQRKQDLEWRKLREHLHLQLLQDIGRIYTNSVYCDLELVFGSTSVQTHCSILKVRAARFFTKLCSVYPAVPHTVLLDNASVDYIESFIRSLYTKCTVTDEEGAVRYLEELHNFARSNGDSGLSPESDVFLTPNSSPSEIYHHFDVTKTHGSDNTKSASAETLINLQKTNQSYYTIVPVEEAFIEENNSNKSLEVCDILEKELAEQDELLKSFHSIRFKEDKQSTVKKINKPTSLLFTSSQYTKKYKRGCDITYTRYKKEGKDLLESKLQPSSRCKEDWASLNASQAVHKEQNNGNVLRTNSLRKDKYLVDKFESRENTIREEEERELSKNTSGRSKNLDYCVELQNSATNNDILEEEFMESPGEGVDCELECCKNKEFTAEDLLNFPCSPEMDASGGGPDSGLDTSSTGCMPGGGFSSPRDHTVSETSGIDLTEAAIGEDMPHDGDVDILLRKPVKSSTSSSVSSDAGTWDSTFPSTHFHDTHVTDLDGVIGCVVPSGGTRETLRDPCDDEKYPVSPTPSQYEPMFLYSDEPPIDNISKLETDRELNINHLEEKGQDLEVKLREESAHGAHTRSSNVCTSPENIPPQNMCVVPSHDNWSTQSEGIAQEASPIVPETIVQEISFQTNRSSDKLTESLPFCSEDAHGWKVANQNNYFINAADLADDVMLLPPAPATSEQDKITADTDTSELEIHQKSSNATSPCEEHISTCDIVNKGITECLNIREKYIAGDTLSIEAHAEALCEGVVPFLSSHINITNEMIVMNDFEHLNESNLKTDSEDPASDPLMMKVTPARVGRDELELSSGLDVFAEFQKEIKVTEHLEPHVNIRKLHGGWKHTDSASLDDLSKRESQSLPEYVFSDCSKPEIQDVANVCQKEKDNGVSSKEGSVDQVAFTVFSSIQSDETETKSGQLDERKEEEAEERRPSLIRRNTFELDPDDDHLALLRQEYERRQGNLLFQSCIPQFSGHLTGSEGFRDTQSLLMVSPKDEDLNKVEEAQQRSLPAVTNDTSLTETSSCVSDRNEEQVISSKTSVTDSSPVVQPSRVFSNHDIRSLDSVSNDGPLDSLFHPQMSQLTLSQQKSESRQFYERVDQDSENPEEKNLVDIGNSKNKSYMQNNHKGYESEKEQDVDRIQIGDLKRMSSSFDNSTKPVISGALTCSDVMVDEKRSCDSPKKQKRTESTPIVSGGVSSIDFVVPTRPNLDSPVMARRKTESAPILSGGATVIETVPQKVEVKSGNMASFNSAWVVDMSDCSSTSAKPPIEPRRQKKTNVTGNTAQPSEVKGTSQHKQSEMKTTALGFFVDLKDTTTDSQIDKKPRKEIINDRDFKSHESSPGRRNSGVGFFVDLKEQKEPTNKRLMPSEGKEISCHVKADEPKSVTKNASCGFFVNLNKKSVNEQVTESKKLVGAGDDKNDSKNTLFSMFIDIGDTSSKQESSVDSIQGKVSSPNLSSHKKLGFRSQTVTVSSTDSSQTSAFTAMNIDADVEAASQVVKSPSQDETENKKQGFFMFIEAESPVTRRKTLPSNLRSNLNRHSLNLEPHINDQGDDQQKGNGRRHHKRAHSLSVERGNVYSPDKSKSLSSTSLAKSKVRSSSQSLHEAVTSPDQGTVTQFGDGIEVTSPNQGTVTQFGDGIEVTSPDQGTVTQFGDGIEVTEMSLSSRQPSKSYDHLPRRAVSYEGKSENNNETPDTDTCSERKLLSESDSQLPVTCTESEAAGDVFTVPQSCDVKCIGLDIATAEAADPSHQNAALTQEDGQNVCRKPSEPTDLQQNEHTGDVLAIAEGHSLNENVSVRASVETKALSKDSCMETNSKSLETSFVKLSDLDKEPTKTMSSVTDSSDILPSFAAANRMTRSIPETSWIENKLLMTRSIGGGTSSRSLSRLFPHLHTTVSATSSPSNIGRSKSPSTQPDADDNDTQISETSDLSSMQSSMGPSGLEGSTEETDASSSYAGRSGPVSRLGEDLLRMFLEEINPDVTVEVGGRRLKAHKCILSSRCQYFAAILSGGWVESAGNVISLQGFSYNAVHFALCHIYSGTSNIPDTISIVELATLADMLGLEGLKEVIMYTLKVKYCHFFHKPCTMCAAGVLECLPLAAAYGLDDIYRKSLRWITKYFVRIWPTKGFASLPRELIDKCYQQHVVHMTVDNVLETVMCCDKLLATLPNVRWAEPIFGITSQLLEASIKFIANNFSRVLSSDGFLSLGKELSWNISRLEDSLMAATDRLPPDQACQSHAHLHNILTVARSSEPPPEMQWSPSFVELLNRIQKRVEASLVRQAPRAARCPSWGQMEVELRKKIQEAACLVLVPTEEGHRSRHAGLAKRGEYAGSNSVSYTAPRSVSSSGSQGLDLRQVKLAMTQQARRAASGGRVSTLKADTKSRLQSAKKSQSVPHVPPHKAETVSSQAKKVVSENGESTSRPKTWPLRVLENKSKPAKQRVNSSSSSMGTPEKSGAMPRRAGKTVISSSDSSRTSSPAMKRSASSGEGSGRGRAATVGSRNLVRRSETPPGKEIRSKKRKDSEVTAMSTDSLSEVQSNGGDQHSVKDVGHSITSQSSIGTHPDTPSVRQKLGEEVAMSADSLTESVASGEKLSVKTKAIAGVPSHSLGSTRPDTPPIKDRGKKCLGKIGVEATVSTDVLSASEQSLTGETSTGRKIEVAKTVPIPKSPTSKGSHSTSSRFDGSKGNLVKGAKNGETKNEITQPRSPAAAARRVVMRQTIVSPRDSPTFRLRSGVTSSPYTGSPSVRRNLLLATRSTTNDSATSGNNMTSSTAKPEKVIKSLCGQSATTSANKRTPTRLQTRNQPLASPVKSSSEPGRGVPRNYGREAVRGNTGGRGISDVSKANNNATRKVISNGSVHGKNRQNNNEVPTPNKRGESSEEKPLSVGSRSGTFLKDEPTILKKPAVDNVQE